MRYVRAAMFLALAVAGILFGISNQDSASVNFYWFFTKAYPLYIVLFACFLAGTLAALLYVFISGGDMNEEERRLNKRLKEQEEILRSAQAKYHQSPSKENTDGPAGRTP